MQPTFTLHLYPRTALFFGDFTFFSSIFEIELEVNADLELSPLPLKALMGFLTFEWGQLTTVEVSRLASWDSWVNR
jgi:hypothetical protein